ncbi:1851_t:CDS:2, partial [Entrophospora sp. SA101]
GLFSNAEWTELTKEDQLKNFEISDELTSQTYNPSLHHDKEWIHQSVRALVSLWENDFVPLARTQYENWYIVNLMGAVPRYFMDQNIELGAIESARLFKCEHDQKYLHETFKCQKL